MIIPIRCFTCGKLIADKWKEYQEELQKEFNKIVKDYETKYDLTDMEKEHIESKILDKLGFDRYCCRRMLISHVDLCDKI